jgi:hypothetical protein
MALKEAFWAAIASIIQNLVALHGLISAEPKSEQGAENQPKSTPQRCAQRKKEQTPLARGSIIHKGLIERQ